jgi:hypothetical protein
MEQGQADKHGVVGAKAVVVCLVDAIEQGVGVAEHDGLGRPGGARGVEQEGQVRKVHRHLRRGIGTVQQAPIVRQARAAGGPVGASRQHHRVANAREGVAQRLDVWQQCGLCDERDRIGMHEVVVQQLAPGCGVQGHRHGADLAERHVEQQLFGAVLQHHRHVRAGRDTQAHQPVGEAVGGAFELGVTQRASIGQVVQVGPLAKCRGLLRDDMADGQLAHAPAQALLFGAVRRCNGGHAV